MDPANESTRLIITSEVCHEGVEKVATPISWLDWSINKVTEPIFALLMSIQSVGRRICETAEWLINSMIDCEGFFDCLDLGPPIDFRLDEERTLVPYRTRGEGSCGFHALLGTLQDGVYQCDAHQARQEFVDWLRQRHQENDLPQTIVNVLQEHFANFFKAPSLFRRKAREIYEEYRKDYHSLSNDEQDVIKEMFVLDIRVFEAYLEDIQQISSYLLQDELMAVAECFNKKMILFQPEWDRSGKISWNGENLADVDADTICIWYNNLHYERAEIDDHIFSPLEREQLFG